MKTIRKAWFAGSFYPEDPSELRGMVDGFLKEAKETNLPEGAKLRAIIVPHAGYIYSGAVAGAGYKLVKKYLGEKETLVVLIGPSHQAYFEGACIDDSDFWETPLGKVRLDKFDELEKLGEAQKYEHSLEVQIPFLQRALRNFKIVPILTGEIDYKSLAEVLGKIFSENENVLFVVSSDLSHYYTYEKAIEIDRVANEAIPGLDIERVERDVEACGRTGILSIMHLAKKMGWKGIFLDCRNSGDTAGDKEKVVGYGCYGFYDVR